MNSPYNNIGKDLLKDGVVGEKDVSGELMKGVDDSFVEQQMQKLEKVERAVEMFEQALNATCSLW